MGDMGTDSVWTKVDAVSGEPVKKRGPGRPRKDGSAPAPAAAKKRPVQDGSQCGTCAYWSGGRCLRYPPRHVQVVAGGLSNALSFVFPARNVDSPACGEYAEVK